MNVAALIDELHEAHLEAIAGLEPPAVPLGSSAEARRLLHFAVGRHDQQSAVPCSRACIGALGAARCSGQVVAEIEKRARPEIVRRRGCSVAVNSVADRYRMLQALGASGNSSHLGFLGWVERTDREASEKGWALAVEARRATNRINWRDAQLGLA